MVRQNKFERLFIYAIGFLLIMEWVWPLQVIAEIYNIQVFILFLLLDSILYLLRANRFIRLTILTSYMYVTVQYLYFYETVRTLFGPTNFFNDLIVNLGFLTSGEWSKLTDSFRTLLLFIVLWLFLDLVRYWLFVRQNILFFCLLTVIYLAILDTFFPYQAKIAIIRTFVLGVFTSGFLTMRRIVKKEKTHVPKQVMKRFIFPLLSMTVLCSMIGIAIPKAHPIWPDPVPYLESLASHHDQSRLAGSGERIKKVGYGEDDSNLGGPFIHDDQVVFIIKAEHPQYWRVETKDLYTGKGWETSLANQMISIDQSGNVPIYFVEREFLGERTEAQIQIKNNKNHIVYPYGASAISFTIGFPYLFNETKEKLNPSILYWHHNTLLSINHQLMMLMHFNM